MQKYCNVEINDRKYNGILQDVHVKAEILLS